MQALATGRAYARLDFRLEDRQNDRIAFNKHFFLPNSGPAIFFYRFRADSG